MAFNNWPYTNFQDLNLGWILAKIKEALATSATAVAKAEAVESEVGTYSDRISDAEAEADSARNIANTARGEALNAQSDATSALAVGHAAQGTANAAMSAANNAQDTANTALDDAASAERNAATALQLAGVADTNAQNALNDYLDVHITVYPGNSVQADKNVDQILAAVTANKKIRFTADDARTGDTYVTFEYIINPVENTVSDIDIQVFFDTSVSNSILKFLYITFTKRVGTGGTTTYATIGGNVTFSGGGGGGGGISIQDVIDTVNDGDTNALLFTAQTLSAAQQAQVKQNIGISDSGGSYSPYLIPVTQIDNSYSTTSTGYDVFDHILDCRIVFNGVYYYQIGSTLSGAFGHAYFACNDPHTSGKYDVDIFDVELLGNNACTVTRYEKDVLLNGAVPYISIRASASSIPALQPNTLVEYTGDATNLSITLATPSDNSISNEYHFIFHSGSTPTTLTIPNTVRQPDGFTVEANHVYEVSILNNNMTAQGWAVTST